MYQKNPKKLMIGDTSINWLDAKDLPAYLYITIPGSKREKIIEFNKNSIHVLNSENLGLGSQEFECKDLKYSDLPDGIYKIKLQSGFEDKFVEKYYLKTDSIEKEISKSIVRNALNISANNDNFIKTIFEVDWKLTTAKSFLREYDIQNAIRYYNEALDI